MMRADRRVYVDTSALVALYTRESSAAALRERLHDLEGCKMVVTDWALVEFASALSLKQRRGDIDAAQSSLIWQVFRDSCDAVFAVDFLNTDDLARATDFCLRADAGLRAGDALHLAAAQRTCCDALLSLDETLNRNALDSGMTVITA